MTAKTARTPTRSTPMLFSRQRQLLQLLDALGGTSGMLDFQKLLFLYCQEPSTGEAPYDFVPYKFGAFSFTSYADRRPATANSRCSITRSTARSSAVGALTRGWTRLPYPRLSRGSTKVGPPTVNSRAVAPGTPIRSTLANSAAAAIAPSWSRGRARP